MLIYKNKVVVKEEKKEETDHELEDKTEITKDNNRVFTRDQLLITGFLEGEEIVMS